jgi:single-stranded DNA-binding protein
MIKVWFEGYVNEVRAFDWGTVYRVSHNQVIKNHQGEWEVTGRDYFSVSVGNDSQTIRTTFAKDDRVQIAGRLKTKLYDKKDGSGKGVSLEVRAEEMSKIERGAYSTNPPAAVESETLARANNYGYDKPATVPEMQNIWPEVKQVGDDSVPF